MSSNDEESSSIPLPKKRKLQPACDNCRKRKSGGPVSPHDKCSMCISLGVDCTYGAEKKGFNYADGYVKQLEHRNQLLEGLLTKLYPDKTVLYGLVSPLDAEYADYLAYGSGSTSNTPSAKTSALPTVVESEAASKSSELDMIHQIAALSLSSQDDASKEDDLEQDDLSEQWKSFSVVKPEDNRFWGKSSAAMFMQTAMSFKNKNTKGAQIKRRILQNRRPMFWERLPWYRDLTPSMPSYTFPAPDLITKLTDAYFEHVNMLYPLLHRPTFERGIASALHFIDNGFGNVLLLVCAVGSRYTESIDERTLVDGVHSPYSAGWKWYNQVQVVKTSLVDPPTLYDLQLYGLAVQFLTGACAPQTVWNLVGFGIRLAQDVGVHRRKIPREKLTVEDELWKRAFWVLIAVDRTISMGIGRPCAIFDDHFDLDMPIECDDEYWELPDPRLRFRQPDGMPSTVTAFNHHLRLSKIMAFAMTTIYSIKTKFWENMSQEWERHIVTELDSALNNWVNSLPEFLRWDPNRNDTRFFKLSGSLITFYYYVQILVHRPSSSTQGQPSPLGHPSHALSTSAARSCALVLEQQMKRFVVVYPYMQLSAVTAVIVLLLNSWTSTRSGVTVDPIAAQQVAICIDVMRKAEERWYSAGAVMDILNEVRRAGDADVDDDPARTNVKPDESISVPQLGQPNLFSYDIPSFNQQVPLQGSDISPEGLFSHSLHESSRSSMGRMGESERTPFDSGFDPSFSIVNYNDSLSLDSANDSVFSALFENPTGSNLNTHAGNGDEQITLDDINSMEMLFNARSGLELAEWDMFFATFA